MINLQRKIELSLLKSLCGTSIFSLVYLLSLPIFGGFYFVRIGKLKRISILFLAIFFLRVMSGNVDFFADTLFITILKYNAVDSLYKDFRGSPMIAAHNERQASHWSVSAVQS